VTGGGRYAADWAFERACHAYFLRSDRAFALIKGIDASQARQMPGVLAVLTAPDIAVRPQTGRHSQSGREASKLVSPERYPFAADCVRFVGEMVAMVVAESREEAQDAAESIGIDYEELAPVIGAAYALLPGSPQIYPHIPGNLVFDYETGSEAETEAALARAAHVTRVSVQTRRIAGNPMETRTCSVVYDDALQTFDLYLCAQCPSNLRHELAHAFGLPTGRVRIHVQDIGGGFGLRSECYQEYIAQMLAARRLGRPVRWSATRMESFVADPQGRGMQIEGALALDAHGNFLAMRFDFTCDMGAYLLPVASHIMTLNPRRGMAGAYRTPSIYGRFKLAVTNATPVSAYRGAGRPDMAYAIERLVDAAADETGIDPISLRRRNMVVEFPYTTPTGACYDSGDFVGAMEKAVEAADWAGFPGRRATARAAGKLRGIGISTFVEVAGNSIAQNDTARIEFTPSGEVLLHGYSHSTGQGHETVFPEIVARTLGIPPEAVTLVVASPSDHAYGSGSYGSRSAQVAGNLFLHAAQAAIQTGRERLALDWGVPGDEIEFAAGIYRCRERTEALTDLAARLGSQSPHPLNASAGGIPPTSFPNGAHIAEVEIDPDTGAVRICAYTAADDVGVVLNHAIVDGQIIGGLAQAAGQVFGEECIYDPDSGQLMSASFSDYYMPRAGILPDEVQVIDAPVRCTTNDLGVKGVGESGTTGGLSALMNAVVDALRPCGIRHIDPPVTPFKIWQCLQQARARPVASGTGRTGGAA